MTDAPADIDDAGIFALVVLATIATGAGLSHVGLSLWWVVPAFAIWAATGEVVARQLAALKARQEVDG